MPRPYSKHKDFLLARIYKLENEHGTYYGSTVQPGNKRLNLHKSVRNGCSSSKLFSIDKDCMDSWPFPCASLHELEDEEARIILANWDDCVNMVIPGAIRRAGSKLAYKRLPAQKAKQKEYNQRPEVIAKKKEYIPGAEALARRRLLTECKCGGRYMHCFRNHHFKTKKHMEFEGDLWVPPIRPALKPSINCECGGRYTPGTHTRNRHLKTKRHMNFQANSLPSVPSS